LNCNDLPVIREHNSLFFYCYYYYYYYYYYVFAVALRPNAGRGLLILEVSRSHTTTHHSR